MRWFPNFKLFANAKILDVNKSNQWKQLLQKRPPVLSKRTKSWKCTLNLDLEHTSLHFQHKTVSAVLLQVVNGFVLIRLSCMGIDEMSGNYKRDSVTYNHTNSLQDNSDDGLYTVDSFMLFSRTTGRVNLSFWCFINVPNPVSMLEEFLLGKVLFKLAALLKIINLQGTCLQTAKHQRALGSSV